MQNMEQENSKLEHKTKIKYELSHVAGIKCPCNAQCTCRNLPFGGGTMRDWMVRLLRKENTWSHHQHLFEENIRKTKIEKVKGLRILKMRVQQLFTHGEDISSPCTRHKGRQPLIECANHDFNIIYFPFYLYFLFGFLCFFIFLGLTRVFPLLLRIPQL